MKHKYLILKNDEKNELTIQEFAELEKQGEYTLLCEETYSGGTITSEISKGKQALISTLRTISLYPPGLYAAKISESVMNLSNFPSDQMWMNRTSLMKRPGKSRRSLTGCLKIIMQSKILLILLKSKRMHHLILRKKVK